MKTQGTITAALAVFVFGMSMVVSASAATDICKRCEQIYQSCLTVSGADPNQCWTGYQACVSGAQRPCPTPR